jgi:Zn-dependent protease
MSEFSLLQILAGLWGIVTAAWLALMVYRSFVGMREEDTIYLSAGEAKMEAEQRVILARLQKLAPYTRSLGYGSLALALVCAGIWGYGVLRELLR